MKGKYLSDLNAGIQRIVLAQLVRNQLAVDIVEAMLGDLRDHPELGQYIRHDAKKWAGRLQVFCDQYNAGYNQMSVSTGVVEDFTRDAALLFKQYIKQYLFYYEQAIIRVIQKEKIPQANMLSRLAVAKGLVDIVAYIDGYEIAQSKALPDAFGILRRMSFLGYTERHQPAQHLDSVPTTMGMFLRMLEQFNKAFMIEMRQPWQVRYICEDGDDIARAVEVAGLKMQEAMTDYNLIMYLFEPDITLESAIDKARILKKQIENDFNKKFHAGGADKISNGETTGN